MSLKAPSVVEEAKKALADGHCVVIGLQTTGEVCLCVREYGYVCKMNSC